MNEKIRGRVVLADSFRTQVQISPKTQPLPQPDAVGTLER